MSRSAQPRLKQHLIDPEICIRCNTCEETCPANAIVHNEDNYVVQADVCGHCRQCVDPCPTGAINHWHCVDKPYGIEEQFTWTELPARSSGDREGAANDSPRAVAPSSASTPQVNLHNRSHPVRAVVRANSRLTAWNAESDIRHIVVQFPPHELPYLEGQNVGVIPPGLDDKGLPHEVRQYSIASARHGEAGEPGTLALTVRRVPNGACSNYLCDLQPGDPVQLTGPFGSTFLLPQDPDSHLIMICTGTGIAPFRAFIEQRMLATAPHRGRLSLFYGARTPEEMPYREALCQWPESRLDRELCFSRLAGQPKVHVQDRLLTSAVPLAAVLRDDACHLFVCGLRGMEAGVETALAQVCAQAGLDWPALRQRMVGSGRLHMETY